MDITPIQNVALEGFSIDTPIFGSQLLATPKPLNVVILDKVVATLASPAAIDLFPLSALRTIFELC